MDTSQKLLSLFERNKIDSRHFDLHAFSIEATVFINKIQAVKANSSALNHEPIFSINQKRGDSNR